MFYRAQDCLKKKEDFIPATIGTKNLINIPYFLSMFQVYKTIFYNIAMYIRPIDVKVDI